MTKRLRALRTLPWLLMAGVAGLAPPLHAQEAPTPTSNFILAGYGGMNYDANLTDEYENDFTASLSPVLLYSMGRDLLFEAELEFGLSGDLTTTTLEYAQIDYLGFDRVQLIGGKFLLPFGLFSERIHPTWVNKLPNAPLLFGHAHGGVAENSLLPVLSDAGVMARFNQPLGGIWDLDLTVFVTQGPTIVEEGEEGDGHAHSLVSSSVVASQAAPGDYTIPPVGFGVGFADNNKNKMIGGRLGVVKAPLFELYFSGFHAMYDPGNFLDYKGFGLSAEARIRGFELRGEGAVTYQEFETADPGVFETLDSPGYYLQASRRVGAFEPVLRWSQLLDGKVDGDVATLGLEEMMLGINYWLSETVPLKAAYGIHPDADDQLHLAWAFGF